MTTAVALAAPAAPEPDPIGLDDGQHTLELHEACTALLPDYGAARSETERVSMLTRACLRSAAHPEPTGAIERWIVQDVQRPSDLLCALWLARYSGLFRPPRGAPARRPGAVSSVELVPQFERRAAVERVTETMGVLYSNAAYAEQLWARGRHQELVLGYVERVDRNRCDRWSLHAAARQLERQARERGLILTVHHRQAGPRTVRHRAVQPRASATNAATRGDSSPARVTASSSVSGAPISGL